MLSDGCLCAEASLLRKEFNLISKQVKLLTPALEYHRRKEYLSFLGDWGILTPDGGVELGSPVLFRVGTTTPGK